MSAQGFWARRQAGVAAEVAADERAQVEAEAEAREAAVADQSDEEILERLELPEPESLQAGDDFKRFLGEQIPARIRTRALRHLWRTDPVLACVDGLVDYGEDFTDASMIIEGMQTAYQVGKGMTKHVEELARQEAAEAQAQIVPLAEQPPSVNEDAQEESAVETIGEPVLPPHSEPSPSDVAQPDPEPGDQPLTQATAPRRMRFSFVGDPS